MEQFRTDLNKKIAQKVEKFDFKANEDTTVTTRGGFNNFRTRNRHTRPYKSRKKNYYEKQHKRSRRQLRK